MSRLTDLCKAKPARDAAGGDHAAWYRQIQSAQAELEAEVAAAEARRDECADDPAQYAREIKRVDELRKEMRDVAGLAAPAQKALQDAQDAVRDRAEAERARRLSDAQERRAAALAHADTAMAALVACVHDVEQAEQDVLTNTLVADRRNVRETFTRGHADFFPSLLFFLQGSACAQYLLGYSLQWPVTPRTALWSYRCGIRPPPDVSCETIEQAEEPADEPLEAA